MFFRLGCLCLLVLHVFASAHQGVHDTTRVAHYLGNEAVLVETENHKVLFDPFFHKDFGFYQRVPEPIRKKMLDGEAPYNDVDIIVISHAHDDHFSARDVLAYLQKFEKVELVAPQQAIDKLMERDGAASITSRLHPIKLAFGDGPVTLSVKNIDIEAVRIPHAGWPGRADVENMVYRITLEKDGTVMHLGDADANLDHYRPYSAHWQKTNTDLGFPPYWFLQGAEGRYILRDTLNIEHAVGVHVPVRVPELLIQTKEDYFSKPGETRGF